MKPLPLAALALLSLTVTACLQSPPTDYHTLVPSGPLPPATPPRDAPRVGLEPVTLPAAFDRSEILLLSGTNDQQLSSTDAWVAPLDAMVTRIVAEDMAGYLGVDQIFVMPTRRFIALDRIVEVDVVRLQASAGGSIDLQAVWRIYDDREALLRTGRTTTAANFVPGDALDPAVAAINRAFDDLAEALAATVAMSW